LLIQYLRADVYSLFIREENQEQICSLELNKSAMIALLSIVNDWVCMTILLFIVVVCFICVPC
jgi:hypothetical protein